MYEEALELLLAVRRRLEEDAAGHGIRIDEPQGLSDSTDINQRVTGGQEEEFE